MLEVGRQSLGGEGADAFDLSEFVAGGRAQLLDAAEVEEELLFALGAEPFEVVEDGFFESFAAEFGVEAVGELVGLVADVLE